jgi:Protein of unknown function (DUF1161)
MKTTLPFAALVLLAGTAQAASNCDSIRDQIDAKIRAGGVSRFTLTVVDAGTTAAGRNVGSCERGSKKIMYVQDGRPEAAAAASAVGSGQPPHKRGPDGVLTECKDGTVSLGGNCRKQAASAVSR